MQRGKTSTQLDGEAVVLEAGTGGDSSRDAVGTVIWDVVEQPVRLQAIVATILAEYGVGEKECLNGVIDFLNDLHIRGLVTILDHTC